MRHFAIDWNPLMIEVPFIYLFEMIEGGLVYLDTFIFVVVLCRVVSLSTQDWYSISGKLPR